MKRHRDRAVTAKGDIGRAQTNSQNEMFITLIERLAGAMAARHGVDEMGGGGSRRAGHGFRYDGSGAAGERSREYER